MIRPSTLLETSVTITVIYPSTQPYRQATPSLQSVLRRLNLDHWETLDDYVLPTMVSVDSGKPAVTEIAVNWTPWESPLEEGMCFHLFCMDSGIIRGVKQLLNYVHDVDLCETAVPDHAKKTVQVHLHPLPLTHLVDALGEQSHRLLTTIRRIGNLEREQQLLRARLGAVMEHLAGDNEDLAHMFGLVLSDTSAMD
eukprot:s4261_g4.t1